MTGPRRTPGEPRDDTALWLLVGLMALIAVGGMAYGLSYPSLHASNPPQAIGSGAPPQTTGSGASHRL